MSVDWQEAMKCGGSGKDSGLRPKRGKHSDPWRYAVCPDCERLRSVNQRDARFVQHWRAVLAAEAETEVVR